MTDHLPEANQLSFAIDESYFEELRNREFARLDERGHVYLDYTGGNIYPKQLLDKHFEYLSKEVYGNPHSTNPTSLLSTKHVDLARQRVLDFFNAKDYTCIFTANASGALQIVGECYPFSAESFLLLTADNHNSVNGIREYCRGKGGEFDYAQLNYQDLTVSKPQLVSKLHAHHGVKNKLFAFPAQSNVSGVKHPLEYVQTAHDQGWDVLLDAAAYVPTNPLNLSEVQPDFVSISFYKIFGYPTGIGCLLVHKRAFHKLQKPWFAGGTVSLVSVQYPGYYLVENHERFENGTINYLDIPAIYNGLDFIDSIGIHRTQERVKSLSALLIKRLQELKHSNGNRIAKVFGPVGGSQRGGTIIFNISDAEGKSISIEDVQTKANDFLISLRTGCFCNPGIDEVNNCISTDEMAKYYTSHVQGDYHDMVAFLGKMRGAVRISVGIATVARDIEKFIGFVESFRE